MHATCIKENNPCNRKGPRNGLLGKKGIKFIPKQNTHDLLVGTLSIGIPSYKCEHSKIFTV